MPSDYYSDGEDNPTASPEKTSEEATEQQTTLIPKSICPGMKVGEEVVLKIVREHGDEFEVAYAPEPESPEEGETGEGEAASAAPESEMSGMMY